MLQQLKRCLALLLLAVFLFPSVIETADALQHHDAIPHCTDRTQQHIHEHEEHCSICYYINTLHSGAEGVQVLPFLPIQWATYQAEPEPSITLHSVHSHFLRGPPTLS